MQNVGLWAVVKREVREMLRNRLYCSVVFVLPLVMLLFFTIMFYGVNAIESIEANPYILIDIARGVDFKQIDKMAIDLGMEPNNHKRIKSAIKYALIRTTYNGHTCTLKANLIEFVGQLIGVSEEDIEDSLINLKVENEIIVEKREESQEWIYLHQFYRAEQVISENIIRLQKSKNAKKISNINAKIRAVEYKTDINLSEKQKEAVELINEN